MRSTALQAAKSSDEGHGFSRAIKAMPTTALAPEVRFSPTVHVELSWIDRIWLFKRVFGRWALQSIPQGLKPSSGSLFGTAEAVPFVKSLFPIWLKPYQV
jgi:hypothetical protein